MSILLFRREIQNLTLTLILKQKEEFCITRLLRYDIDVFLRELVDPVTCTLCALFEKPSMRKYLRPDYEVSTLLRDFFEPNMPGGTVNELPSYDFSRR